VTATAVLGRFDRLLAEVVGEAPAAVEQSLQLAIEVGLIDRVATGLGFRHDLIRDAVVRSLLPSQADTLHRRAAEVLARHGAPPEEQARHLEAVGEPALAAGLLVEAARRNLDAHALASAEDLAARALQLGPDAVSAADARDVLAASLAAQGRWTEALDLDRQLVAAGRTDASVVGRMADTALHAGHIDEAAAVLSSEAAAALPDPLRGRLQATLALTRGQLESAVELADAACRQALTQDDAPNACAGLDVLGQALDLLGRHDQAADAFGRWVALADEAGLVTSKLHALVSLGGHQLLCGLPATALWEARALGLQTRSYLQLSWAELSLAYAVQFTRPAVEAAALADEAVTRARRFRLDVLPHILVGAAGAHFPLDPGIGDRLLREALGCAPATTTSPSPPGTGGACMRSTTGATTPPRHIGSGASRTCVLTLAARPTTRRLDSRWRCWPLGGATKPPRRCSRRGSGPSTSSSTPSRRSRHSPPRSSVAVPTK
jgi:tetratricopeptide (TPR) repeat protein